MPDIFTTRVAFLSQRDLYIWRDIVNLYIAPMARTKRRNFTNKFKLNAIKLAKRLASNSVAARDFGCSEKNIRDWRRNEHLINAAPRGNRRRPRQNSAKFPAVDLAVCEYIDTIWLALRTGPASVLISTLLMLLKIRCYEIKLHVMKYICML